MGFLLLAGTLPPRGLGPGLYLSGGLGTWSVQVPSPAPGREGPVQKHSQVSPL